MNTIKAVFKPGARRVTTTDSLTQYDYGQILMIDGLDLPSPFEAHFSNTQFDGNSKPWPGMDNQVEIPDEYLESGNPIYVLIFLHYGENDGKTEYRITIPVEKRPRNVKVPIRPIQQGIIESTIAAINVAAARAEDEANAAEAAKEAIQNMHVQAETIGPDDESSVEKVVDPDTGEVTLIFGVRRGEQGKQGDKGDTGAVFVPNVSSSGIMSWTNDGDLENPDPYDIVSAVLDALPHAEEAWF